jgi:hypothetical protein
MLPSPPPTVATGEENECSFLLAMGVSICCVEFSTASKAFRVSRAGGVPKHSFRLGSKHRRIVVELGAKWTISKNHQLSSEHPSKNTTCPKITTVGYIGSAEPRGRWRATSLCKEVTRNY